jgi:hypothetical protein
MIDASYSFPLNKDFGPESIGASIVASAQNNMFSYVNHAKSLCYILFPINQWKPYANNGDARS